jgi:hypothetical protein
MTMKSADKLRYRLPVIIVLALSTILYAWTYAFSPLSETVNSFILNGATALSALLVAIILTRITFYFHQGEPPRVIWTAFAVCMWLWTIAEAIWGSIYMTSGEVPAFSMADGLWFLGYIALTISITRQLLLIHFEQKYAIRWAAAGVWAAILLGIETILLVTKSERLMEDFFRYFYLFADTAVGLSAIYLVHAFRGRALAIPWLTISSFVVTDFLYIRLTETGVYDYIMSGVSIALLADTLYVAAYLIVAWGVFEQYLLLRSSTDHSQA